MKLASCSLLLALIVMAPVAATPDRAKEGTGNMYDKMIKEIDEAERAAEDPKASLQDVKIFTGGTDEERRKRIKEYGKALKAFANVGKIVMDQKAPPTDEELTKLGKELTETVREIPLKDLLINHMSEGKPVMTPENLKIIVDILSTNVKHEGNKYLDQLKEKNKKLYCKAMNMKEFFVGQDVDMEKQIMANCAGYRNIPLGFAAKEVLEYVRSEEQAIQLVKDISVLVQALRNPKSFDSLDNLRSALSRSKRWQAHAVLFKELEKCVANETLSDEEKTDIKTLIKEFLRDLKNYISAVDSEEKLLMALMYIPFNVQMMDFTEVRQTVKECLVTSETVSLMAVSSETVLDDQTLQDIKKKDEKAWALLYIINQHVKAIRSRDGLGKEADAFIKKTYTVPHIILIFGKLLGVSSEELLRKGKEFKNGLADDFNALPAAAKEELVHRFPFRTLGAMAIFH